MFNGSALFDAVSANTTGCIVCHMNTHALCPCVHNHHDALNMLYQKNVSYKFDKWSPFFQDISVHVAFFFIFAYKCTLTLSAIIRLLTGNVCWGDIDRVFFLRNCLPHPSKGHTSVCVLSEACLWTWTKWLSKFPLVLKLFPQSVHKWRVWWYFNWWPLNTSSEEKYWLQMLQCCFGALLCLFMCLLRLDLRMKELWHISHSKRVLSVSTVSSYETSKKKPSMCSISSIEVFISEIHKCDIFTMLLFAFSNIKVVSFLPPVKNLGLDHRGLCSKNVLIIFITVVTSIFLG